MRQEKKKKSTKQEGKQWHKKFRCVRDWKTLNKDKLQSDLRCWTYAVEAEPTFSFWESFQSDSSHFRGTENLNNPEVLFGKTSASKCVLVSECRHQGSGSVCIWLTDWLTVSVWILYELLLFCSPKGDSYKHPRCSCRNQVTVSGDLGTDWDSCYIYTKMAFLLTEAH